MKTKRLEADKFNDGTMLQAGTLIVTVFDAESPDREEKVASLIERFLKGGTGRQVRNELGQFKKVM